MKKLYTLFLLISFSCSAQQFDWISYSTGNAGNTATYNIAVDKMKNSYVTGVFGRAKTFGNITLTEDGGGHGDIFLAKYDSIGNFLWVQQIKGLGSDEPHGLAVDSMGNCYLTGEIGWTATFGSGADTATIKKNQGDFDIFIAKYNRNGKLLWVKSPGSKKNDYCKDIAIDVNGNVYINGWVNDTATFGEGGNMKTINVTRNAMITAKYDNNGNFIWVAIAKGDDQSYLSLDGITGYGVGTDKYGNVYICGSGCGSNTFIDSTNTISITSPLNRDPFIAKYSTDGKLLWVKKGTNGNNIFTLEKLTTDENGNSYLSGNFDGSITFDGTTINSSKGGILLAKFDKDGNLMWAKAQGNIRGTARCVVSGNNGNCYITGVVDLPAVFGEGANQQSITGSSAGSSFAAEYDSAGNLLSLFSFHDMDSYGIDIDNSNNIYVTGDTSGWNGNLIIGNMAVAKIKKSLTANLQEVFFDNIFIYPNPTGSLINISCSGMYCKQLSISVKNTLGQEIYSSADPNIGSEYKKTIDLSKENKGIYFIELIADGERSVKKVVLQ